MGNNLAVQIFCVIHDESDLSPQWTRVEAVDRKMLVQSPAPYRRRSAARASHTSASTFTPMKEAL
jgi:hypothetical protein